MEGVRSCNIPNFPPERRHFGSLIGGGIFDSVKNSDKSEAITNTDTTSYVSVGELWNSNDKTFNKNNVDILYKYLTGSASGDYDSVASLASSTTTAANIRGKTLSAGSGYSAKTSSQDVIVMLGGLKWEVVYLSNNTDGEPVLTLWLSNSTQDAFAGRSKTEGTYYGYLNGGLYSNWSGNWSSSTVGNYPSNMYGTSYIRAVTLNNGGQYAISNSALSASVSKSSSNVFAPFTMEAYGLTEYIITPNKMSWQKNQSAITTLGNTYTNPNEAISPSTTNWDGGDYSGKTNYTAWANDYLWLPSLTETGYSDSRLGLWGVSIAQRQNHDGSTSSLGGSVGSTIGSAYAFSWLRSGTSYTSVRANYLSPSGANYSSDFVSGSKAVRPALHLNLKKIKEGFTYWLDVNGLLDGQLKSYTSYYGRFDVKIDGKTVLTDVEDCYLTLHYGQTYEVFNIEVYGDKIYGGCTYGAIKGTITNNTPVELSFRTKTWEDYASSSYASGSGTETSPYIIKTPEQLGKLAKDSRSSNLSGKYYKLGSNIDLSAHIWQGIGTGDYRFGGNFNGDFYSIRNIKTAIDYYKNYRVGLFSWLCNATIQNLSIKDCKLDGLDWVGTVAGNVDESTIRNIIVQNVTLNSDEGHVGGITGTLSGVLESCVSKDINITCGHWEAGGITGSFYGGSIKDCSVINANLSGPDRIGLVYGYVNSGLTLKSTYCQGIVKGANLKTMYGGSSAWGNWSYSPLLNGGYPVQKTLFAIGGLTGSQNVYNYLTSTLKFSVV